MAQTLVFRGLAAVAFFVAGKAHAQWVAPTAFNLTSLEQLSSMTDAQLAATYANPLSGNPALPVLTDGPNHFVFCEGRTFFNKWSPQGAESGPLPVGPYHPVNAFLANIWMGKLFELTSDGETFVWQLLHSNRTVGLQARAEILPTDVLGRQVPTIRADYSQSEIVLGRAFLDEMRLVGPNLYLGMAYLVDPFVAWWHLPQNPGDALLEAGVAALGTAVLEAALALLSLGSLPLPLMFFGLHCGAPIAHFDFIPLSLVSLPADYALGFFPPGYLLPAPITPGNG